MKRFTLMFKLLLINMLAVLAIGHAQAETQIGQDSGHISFNGWEIDYDMFQLSDGLNLKDVTYNGVQILARANFPVMSVYYEGNCGPYADRLNGPRRSVPWAGNATLVAREFTQAGKQWFELGIREFIGSYDIYQSWYIGSEGELDGHLFSRGLQCNYDHVHYPMWRLDFDIDGSGNDQIVRENSSGQRIPYSTEFQTNATDAYQHRWFVEDTVSGHQVRIDFDSGAWNVGGTVQPQTAYAQNLVGGVVARSSQAGWTGGASRNFPYRNGESLVNQDIAVWYRGYLPHSPEEGGALWHSTGFRISANLANDTDGDGLPNSVDLDDDNDGVNDDQDAFPLDASESVDTDSDGIGNNADTDDDGDGVSDANDAFPLNAGESVDTDNDGIGNNADTDDDGDGVSDANDAFPLDSGESVDTDNDGIGNNADTDDDGDGIADVNDPFPLDADETVDTDGDGIGNNTDTDDDGDGVSDTNDAFPLNANESVDTDGDGIGNNADTDDDGDGYADTNDVFPLDPSEWADSDGDGIGDNADPVDPDPTSCNILDNGSVDVNADSWSTNTTLSIVSDSAQGTGAMQFGNGYASTVVQATPNTRYAISGYSKGPSGSGWAGLGVDFVDASGNELSEVFLTIRPSASYGVFDIEGMSPAGTAFARMWIYAASGRTITVDELDIRPVGCTGGGINQPPVVTSPGNQVTVEGESVNLQITATDREGANLSFSASTLPAGLSLSSTQGRITGTPVQVGQTQVSVVVSDGTNQTSVSFNWQIVPDGTVVSQCNLLPNGSFETDAGGWFSSNTSIQLVADAAEGQQAGQITGGSISAKLTAQAGTAYQLSGLYKSTAASGWSGYGIDYLNAAEEEIAEEVVTLQPTAAYAPIDLSGTVPTGAVYMRLWIFTSSSRTLTLDDLKLRDATCGL